MSSNRDIWKSRDRERPPCVHCGEELYDQFWGNGGWAPASKATNKLHSDIDCIERLKKTLVERDCIDSLKKKLAEAESTMLAIASYGALINDEPESRACARNWLDKYASSEARKEIIKALREVDDCP